MASVALRVACGWLLLLGSGLHAGEGPFAPPSVRGEGTSVEPPAPPALTVDRSDARSLAWSRGLLERLAAARQAGGRALVWLALAHDQRGDREAAEATLREALGADPAACRELARLFRDPGLRARAEAAEVSPRIVPPEDHGYGVRRVAPLPKVGEAPSPSELQAAVGASMVGGGSLSRRPAGWVGSGSPAGAQHPGPGDGPAGGAVGSHPGDRGPPSTWIGR